MTFPDSPSDSPNFRRLYIYIGRVLILIKIFIKKQFTNIKECDIINLGKKIEKENGVIIMINFKELRQEAKSLNIRYAGLTGEELEHRINDKKNGTGIYENAPIDPDTNIDELIKIAFDFDIKTYSPSLSHEKLIQKINDKITQGYEIGKRYHNKPCITELNDSDLLEHYNDLLNQTKNDMKNKDIYHDYTQCSWEARRRGLELPNVNWGI